MDKRKCAIGVLIGISTIAIGAMCICLGRKNTVDKGDDTPLSTSIEQEDAAIGLEIDTASSESQSMDTSYSQTTDILYVDAPDGSGNTEEISIETPVPGNYNTESIGIEDNTQEEPVCIQIDMTSEYEQSIQEVFGDDMVTNTPATESCGASEGGIH